MRFHPIYVLAVVGCREPAAERWQYDDVARLIGATVATSDGGATSGAVTDSLLLARGEMPAGFTLDNGMAYGDHGALHHEYVMIECRDASGAILKPCNQLTDLATVVARWSGILEGPDFSVQTDRQGKWTITGLQRAMPAITGTSKLRSLAVVDGLMYHLDASETEAMLTPTTWRGGALHFDLDIAVAMEPATPATADLQFDDGMATALLVLDGEFRYRIDLATGAIRF